jgi:hypothetical protein
VQNIRKSALKENGNFTYDELDNAKGGNEKMDRIEKTVFARYKNSTWPVILYSSGRLACKGPGYGSWGTSEVSINQNVQDIWAAGTSRGPGILYQLRNSLRAVFLLWSTGKTVVSGHVCNAPPKNVRVEAHKYGVVFFVELADRLVRAEIDGWGHLKVE